MTSSTGVSVECPKSAVPDSLPCPPEEMNLFQATQFGYFDRCHELIESRNVDVNRPDNEDCYPLHWAALNNSMYLIDYFIGKGAIVDQPGGILNSTPLHWAVRTGHLGTVVILVLRGADPLLTDSDGLNALMLSAAYGHTHCLAYFIAKLGDLANLDDQDNLGRTVATWAASRNCKPDPIRLLAFYGADFRIPDAEGKTPLHWTIICRCPRAARAIVATEKFEPLSPANDFRTPIDFALETKQKSIANLLRLIVWRRDRRSGAGGKSRLQCLLNEVRYNEDLQAKYVSCAPCFLFLFVGLVLESEMSFPMKMSLIVGYNVVFHGPLILFASTKAIVTRLPIAFTMSIMFWLYFTFFYFSFPIRNYMIFFEIVMWVGLPSMPILTYLVVKSNPGHLKSNRKEGKEAVNREIVNICEIPNWDDSSYAMEDFCHTCMVRKPLRTHHCSVCDKCVVRFDHHCPWINNCVGLDNVLLFFLYLVFMLGHLAWAMHGHVIYAMTKIKAPLVWSGDLYDLDKLARESFVAYRTLAQASPWNIFCFTCCCVFFHLVIGLFLSQVKRTYLRLIIELVSAFMNQTASERVKYIKRRIVQGKNDKDSNPFGRGGYLQNFVDMFGIKLPLLPKPSTIDWARCYTMHDLESQTNECGCKHKQIKHSAMTGKLA